MSLESHKSQKSQKSQRQEISICKKVLPENKTFEGCASQSLSRHRNFENFMFRKTPHKPAQCKQDDHDTIITKLDMKTTQAGLARICGVTRNAIWYRIQKGHLRPDENGLLDVSRARRALKRRGSRIFIPYNERELLEIEKLKLQTYKLRKQIGVLEGSLVPINKLDELMTARRLDVFEIFREHMIEDIYLELAEETSDLKIYGKLLQACQEAAYQFSETQNINPI